MNAAAIAARFARAPLRVKAAAVAAAIVLAAAFAAAFALSRDTRVPLFATPLSADQLREVEDRLAAWGVAYAPRTDNVLVAQARRADLRLRLSVAGVPHAHLPTAGELFAHAGALTPQSVLEAQTREGLAAEIALGLRGLDGVADARVVIAPARAGVYADEASHDASAAVRVTLAPGARLNARAIAGIKAFVASGVPALDAERVAVVDDRGLVLDGDAAADADGVQAALQSALDAAFGEGAAIVRVHREVLAEKRDVRTLRRAPLGGAVARSAASERYTSGRKTYAKTNDVEDRGSDVREERRSALPGAAERLSVAVLVDAARGLDLAKIRGVAAAAAGIDPRRGDVLEVAAVAFAREPARRAHFALWPLVSALTGTVPQLLVGLAVAAALAFAVRPAAHAVVRALEASSVRRVVREAPGIPPARMRGALAGEPPHIAAAIISALPAATAAAVLELYPQEERAQIVRRLSTARSGLLPAPHEVCERYGLHG